MAAAMKRLILVAAILLAGCQSQGDIAADNYAAASASGATDAELCRGAQAVAEAYRASQDAAKAAKWDQDAEVKCATAALKSYNDSMPWSGKSGF